jgi:hypothetical protein
MSYLFSERSRLSSREAKGMGMMGEAQRATSGYKSSVLGCGEENSVSPEITRVVRLYSFV